MIDATVGPDELRAGDDGDKRKHLRLSSSRGKRSKRPRAQVSIRDRAQFTCLRVVTRESLLTHVASSNGDRLYRIARASRTKSLKMARLRVSLRTRDKIVQWFNHAPPAHGGGINEVSLRLIMVRPAQAEEQRAAQLRHSS